MKRVKLRGTDLELSNICLGGGGFGAALTEERAFEILDAFAEAGGNFIDTANVYCRWIPGKANCSEEILGKWLKSRNAKGSAVIATKGGHYDFANPQKSRITEAEIRKDLEESLKTLGLDHIDLYWLHRDDETKPVELIVDMLEKLVREGLIRFYGASNYKLDRIKAAKKHSLTRKLGGFSAVSNQWSLASVNPGANINPDPTLAFMTEDYYLWHRETLTPMIPYSSTAFGFFEKLKNAGGDETKLPEETRKAYVNRRNLEIYKELARLSRELGVSAHALSLAWLTNQPFDVIPINSVRNTQQLKDIIQASEIELDINFLDINFDINLMESSASVRLQGLQGKDETIASE